MRPDDGKPFKVDGQIEVPWELSFDEFYDDFLSYVKERGWNFTGYIKDLGDENVRDLRPERTHYAIWVANSATEKRKTWWTCSNCHVAGSPRWRRCPVCEARMLEKVEVEIR